MSDRLNRNEGWTRPANPDESRGSNPPASPTPPPKPEGER